MATNSGLTFSDDGVLEVTLRPGDGVPDTATVMGGWAVDESGKGYIEAASVVPDTAVQTGGLSYTQDGALYVTSATPSNPVYIGGRAVRQDGALHVKTGTPSGDDQALGGWMTSNAGQAYVDLLPSFWLPLNDLGDGEVDITLGMGTGSGTFTRATTATTVDSTGMIVSVASGVPRSYYDPTTLEYRGYLAEGARTNLCLQSQDLATTWTLTNATITANAITAPDGTLTADLLTQTASGGRVEQIIDVAAGGVVTYTIFIKKSLSVDLVGFILRNNTAAVNFSTNYTFSTNAFSGTSANTTVSSVLYPNGWVRVRITADTAFTAGDDARLYIYGGATAGTADSVYAWGAQLEVGSFASTYIPTTTAAVIRNADVLTYPFSGNADATVGTCYAEIGTEWANNTVVFIGFAAANVGMMIAGDATTVRIQDGTNNANKTGLTSAQTAPRKRAISWGGAGIAATGDGAAQATGSFDGNMGNTAIAIGCRTDGIVNAFGTIRNARIFTVQFSAAQLQAITS